MLLLELSDYHLDSAKMTKDLSSIFIDKLKQTKNVKDFLIEEFFIDGFAPYVQNYIDSKHLDVELELHIVDSSTTIGQYGTNIVKIFISEESTAIQTIQKLLIKYTPVQIAKSNKFLDTILPKFIAKYVSIIIHEINHAYQENKSGDYYTQTMSNSSTNYADKLEQEIYDIDYYASYDEIDSHALTFVAKEIAKMQHKPIQEQKQIISSILKSLYDFGKEHLHGYTSNKKHIDEKIIKRYVKNAYKRLTDYLHTLD